jgi:hypothetical protein
VFVEVAFALMCICVELSTLKIVVEAGIPVPLMGIPATIPVVDGMFVIIAEAFVVLPVVLIAIAARSVAYVVRLTALPSQMRKPDGTEVPP